MSDVTVISKPNTDGKRLALVLTEDRVGHYPEFRDYFVRTFALDRIGLAEPGYVQSTRARPKTSDGMSARPSRRGTPELRRTW